MKKEPFWRLSRNKPTVQSKSGEVQAPEIVVTDPSGNDFWPKEIVRWET
jgi:hypothetical protein